MSKEKIILEEKFIDLECLSELEKALCNDCSTSVFVGRCNSMLSAMAYTALELVESADGEVKYLVLSDGKDLAVAVDDRHGHVLRLFFPFLGSLFFRLLIIVFKTYSYHGNFSSVDS